MKRYSWMIFYILGCITVKSQISTAALRSAYDSATIFHYRSNQFKLNDKKIKKIQLARLLLSNEESAVDYRAFKRSRRIATILLITAGTIYVASFFVVEQNPDLALGMLGGGFLTGIASTPAAARANEHLLKSVWLYNRARLLRAD